MWRSRKLDCPPTLNSGRLPLIAAASMFSLCGIHRGIGLAADERGSMSRKTVLAALALTTLAVVPTSVRAEGTVGTTFPAGFQVPTDHSLGTPVIGFGGARHANQPLARTPVVFLHGNNDTPYPTTCNGSYGAVQKFAQFFADHGYATSELWALGYQGDQCDLLTDETRRAKEAHSTVANVPDLRNFIKAVLDYTGATQVDLVGHSLGATLSREWMRQDDAYKSVRRLVSIDGPHHGIINCSPNPLNYYQAIGFVPDSAVCLEYGAADTPFLQTLNQGDETPGPTEYLAMVNTDASFVYMSKQDGVLPAVPAEDRTGAPHDFSNSAHLTGAHTVELTGQGQYDMALLAAHTGIVASPQTWQATFDFLTRTTDTQQAGTGNNNNAAPNGPAPSPAAPSGQLPATGAAIPTGLAALATAAALGFRRAQFDIRHSARRKR